ncbi:FAD-dependent oxidoreductase [Nocardioides ferulae]|uniref:FAD-dependent oxidoreductase n=1 Tax=Nocardioides ferulae TaxID=2340821 RepID=UPI000EAC2AE7|nr:FAD-dependent oxidoreductase [Nocardioides ferulae]
MTLTSVWRARRPRTEPDAPEVGGHYDIVVIGAGLTGLTTAGLLARAGRSVLVLEARHVGAGTTQGSTAKISLLQGLQFSRISRRQPTGVLRDYAEGNREAQAWLARFCGDHGVAMQRRAAYTYAHGAIGERMARAELKAVRKAGLDAEWVDELSLPYPTRGGVRMDDQCQVDPVELLEALAADAVAHGVTLVEGARVQRVHGHEPTRVITEHGAATAENLIVATNLPILDRGGFFARAKPARSYGLAYRTPVQAVDGMYLSADAPSRSLRDAPADDGGHLLLVGGNGHKVGAPISEQSRIDDLRAWTAEHYPQAVETHAWSAQDYVPHHGLPYVGPLLPGRDDILVAGGYSKWGMTNGVAAALALSGQLLGGHMTWARAFRSWTPRELTGLPQSAYLNAEVGLELTWGYLRPLRHAGAQGAAPGEGDGFVRYDGPGRPTAVSRVDGVERRVSAVCTHLGGVLRWNDAEASWDCPLHGSRFGPDGRVLEGVATCPLKEH